MRNSKNVVYSAMFLAIGMVLPLFTAQIKEIGDTLLPMHFPILLCGLVCGPWYGLGAGLMLPFFRSILFSMPPIYPNAVWMALELATYGFVIGILYRKSKKTLGSIYISLVTAMISGRIVWGLSKTLLLGLGGKPFSFGAFLAGGFLDAIPGIVIQLLLIPTLMLLIQKHQNKM